MGPRRRDVGAFGAAIVDGCRHYSAFAVPGDNHDVLSAALAALPANWWSDCLARCPGTNFTSVSPTRPKCLNPTPIRPLGRQCGGGSKIKDSRKSYTRHCMHDAGREFKTFPTSQSHVSWDRGGYQSPPTELCEGKFVTTNNQTQVTHIVCIRST